MGIRLIVPYYGFTTPEVPKQIPAFLAKEVTSIKNASFSKEHFLRSAFQLLVDRYYGGRWETLVYANRAFEPIGRRESGFIPCNIFNHLMRTILVASGEFSNDEIKTVVVPLNFFIHQYLKVRIGDRWIDIDPTYHRLGIPYGKHAIWFA